MSELYLKKGGPFNCKTVVKRALYTFFCTFLWIIREEGPQLFINQNYPIFLSVPDQCFFFGLIPEEEVYYLIKNRFKVEGVMAKAYFKKNCGNMLVTED